MIKANKSVYKLTLPEKLISHQIIFGYIPIALVSLFIIYIIILIAHIIASNETIGMQVLFMGMSMIGVLVGTLFIDWVVDNITDEEEEYTSLHKHFCKLFSSKDIPDDLKLLINLCYYFNNKKNEYGSYRHTFVNYSTDKRSLKRTISIMEYIEQHPDVTAWIRDASNECLKHMQDEYKDFKAKSYTFEKLLPVALNIADTPDVFKHSEAYTDILRSIYTAACGMEMGIDRHKAFVYAIDKAVAESKIDAWSQQDFSKTYKIGD